MTDTSRYDVAKQVNHAIWRYTNRDTQKTWEIPFSLRMFYPQEINALLRYNSFAIENKFGWYDESSYEDASPQQLIVCR